MKDSDDNFIRATKIVKSWPSWKKNYTLTSNSPEIKRVNGGLVCSICNKTYYEHPPIHEEPYLTLLCNEERVKL